MRGKVRDQADCIDGAGADLDGSIGGDCVKFNLKSAFIAALIAGMVLGVFMLIACATYGAWGKFCIWSMFMGIQAFVLGGLLDD